MRAESRLGRLTVFGLFASALLVLAGGCGGGSGDVTGKVTFKGKPVVYGTITFVGTDGLPKAAPIADDGSYTLSGVALGEAKILVDSPKPVASNAPGGGGAKGRPGIRPGGREDPEIPKEARRTEIGDTPNTVAPEVAAKWVPIPDKYKDPTQSPLRYAIKKGSNTHDVQLD